MLTFGGAFQRTLSTWAADSWKFAAVFVVVDIPVLLFGAWVFSSQENWVAHSGAWDLVSTYGGGVLAQIAIGATVHGVFQRLVGRPADLNKCLSTGASRFASLFGVAFFTGLYTVGLAIMVALAVMLPLGAMLLSGGVSVFAIVVIAVVAFIPRLIVSYLFWTAAPVAVVEERAAGDSMRRARELQRGNQGPIAGIAALLFGVQSSVGLVLLLTTGMPDPEDAGGLSATESLSMFEAARTSALITTGVELLILLPLLAVAAAVVYHDLRHGKEGVATAELIRVFE